VKAFAKQSGKLKSTWQCLISSAAHRVQTHDVFRAACERQIENNPGSKSGLPKRWNANEPASDFGASTRLATSLVRKSLTRKKKDRTSRRKPDLSIFLHKRECS
jgi:hypothetical protein